MIASQRTGGGAAESDGRVMLGDIGLDALSEVEVLAHIERAWSEGRGGMVVTPNVDIWRLARRDAEANRLLRHADIVVADGVPLLWAARLAGTPLPERVTGSGLVEALAGRAATLSKSVYIVGGGAEDTADRAAVALRRRYPGLRVIGRLVPPYGFDTDQARRDRLVADVCSARPDLVFIGLGFPRQEMLAELILRGSPPSWILGCGAGVTIAAGEKRRANTFVQRVGAEWLFRLVQEPRRLAKRYLVHDAPAALHMLWLCFRARMRPPGPGNKHSAAR